MRNGPGARLILITNKEEWFQFFLTSDALDAIAFVKYFMAVDIEHFMGSTKGIDGFEVEQQVIELFQLTLH